MSDSSIESRSALTAAILLGTIGLSMGNLAPLFVGVFDEQLAFGLDRAGAVAAAEILGVSLSAALAVFWIRRVNWQTSATAGLLVCTIGNLITPLFDNFAALLAIRATVGLLGEGVLFAISVAALSEHRHSDRAFAFLVAAQVTWAVLGFILLPYAVLQWGLAGLALPIATASAAVLLTVRYLPTGEIASSARPVMSGTSPAAALWAIAAQFTWYFGVVALFDFVERIGDQAGLPPTDIGLVLGVGMAVSLIGSAFAYWQGDRLRRLMPFILTMLVQILAASFLIDVTAIAQFAIAWTIVNTVWNYGLPYLYGGAAAADESGRLIVLMPAAQGFGGAFGVALAGWLAHSYGLGAVIYMMIATNLIAGLCFARCVRLTDIAAAK